MFSPSFFAPNYYAPTYFGPGPFGLPGEESQIKPGSGSSYDEYFRRQYEKQRIRENNEEIIEIVKILLKQGIL